MAEYTINGVKVNFPYKPYPSQLTMMDKASLGPKNLDLKGKQANDFKKNYLSHELKLPDLSLNFGRIR